MGDAQQLCESEIYGGHADGKALVNAKHVETMKPTLLNYRIASPFSMCSSD